VSPRARPLRPRRSARPSCLAPRPERETHPPRARCVLTQAHQVSRDEVRGIRPDDAGPRDAENDRHGPANHVRLSRDPRCVVRSVGGELETSREELRACLHRTHRCIGRDSGARTGASELAQEPQKPGVLGAARESLFGDVPREPSTQSAAEGRGPFTRPTRSSQPCSTWANVDRLRIRFPCSEGVVMSFESLNPDRTPTSRVLVRAPSASRCRCGRSPFPCRRRIPRPPHSRRAAQCWTSPIPRTRPTTSRIPSP
jgi:hypothetical protein